MVCKLRKVGCKAELCGHGSGFFDGAGIPDGGGAKAKQHGGLWES